ncbi:MAG: YgiT-type zinc finger protein [Deltaproteobacteria bacterium]|nr:YgiT-type zinc finger protein [Deltaproteobacteria bacterium]
MPNLWDSDESNAGDAVYAVNGEDVSVPAVPHFVCTKCGEALRSMVL